MSTTKKLIHVLLELHILVVVLYLSIGIYFIIYTNIDHTSYISLHLNYFIILCWLILSKVETSSKVLCLSIKKNIMHNEIISSINQIWVSKWYILHTTKKRGYPSVLKSAGIAPKNAGIGSKFLSRRFFSRRFKPPLFECGDRVLRTCTNAFQKRWDRSWRFQTLFRRF